MDSRVRVLHGLAVVAIFWLCLLGALPAFQLYFVIGLLLVYSVVLFRCAKDL